MHASEEARLQAPIGEEIWSGRKRFCWTIPLVLPDGQHRRHKEEGASASSFSPQRRPQEKGDDGDNNIQDQCEPLHQAGLPISWFIGQGVFKMGRP